MTETPKPTLGQRYNSLVYDFMPDCADDICVDPKIKEKNQILRAVAKKSEITVGVFLAILAAEDDVNQRAKTEGLLPAVQGANNAGVV